MNFRKVETLGGIGSILTGGCCAAIGYMDYTQGQSWGIWAIMLVVLVINGMAMIKHKRLPEKVLLAAKLKPVAGPRTTHP